MTSLIESLESRTLLSTSPQLVALNIEGKVINADLKAAQSVDNSGVKTIGADLKAAHLDKADKALLRALSRGDAAEFKVLGKAISRVEKGIVKDAQKLVSEGHKLIRKPGNAKLIAAVTGLKTILMADAAAGLTVLTTDGTAVLNFHDVNANSIAAANPTQLQVQTDVAAAHNALTVAMTGLGNDVNVALTTDVNNIIALF